MSPEEQPNHPHAICLNAYDRLALGVSWLPEPGWATAARLVQFGPRPGGSVRRVRLWVHDILTTKPDNLWPARAT
jgi:hypothetical protein